MTVQNHQSTDPFVRPDGRTTETAQVVLDKLVAKIRELEARIVALEP